MSPPPPPLDAEAISTEVKQGGIAGLLGMMGMAVKIILTEEKMRIGQILLHLFAAIVVAVLSGYALSDYVTSQKMLWAANGVSGFMAIRIAMWAERVVGKKLDEAEAKIGKKTKPKKTNAKRPAKRRK
jgi:di/tricarboxylate transporter